MPVACPVPLYPVGEPLHSRVAGLFGSGVACRRRRRARGLDPVGERGVEIVAPLSCGDRVCAAGWILVGSSAVYAGAALLLDRGGSQIVTPVHVRRFGSLEEVLASGVGEEVRGCVRALRAPVSVPLRALPPGSRLDYVGAPHAVLTVKTWMVPEGVLAALDELLGPPVYRFRNHRGETRSYSLLAGACRRPGESVYEALAEVAGAGMRKRSAHR